MSAYTCFAQELSFASKALLDYLLLGATGIATRSKDATFGAPGIAAN